MRGAATLAHGVGTRADLPIPFSFAVTGAAVALVLSFAALALLWREPRLRGEHAGRPLPRRLAAALDSSALRWTLRLGGLAATAYVLAAAFLGPDLATNPTAGVVYVLLWVGLVPASLLLGPVWRLLNPLRTVHALLARALRTDPREGLLPLPAGLGYWPAAAGLFAFVWLELVAPDRATLPVLRTWLALYAGTQLLAAAVYGSRWFDRGDAFEVWSDLVGRLSVLGRRADGRLVLRSPLDGMASLRGAPGLAAVAIVLLGSTAYDSVSNAPLWFRFAQQGPLPPVVAGTVGLAGMVAAVGIAYGAATAVAGSLGKPAGAPWTGSPGGAEGAAADVLAGDGPRAGRRLPGEFAHTIVPIAIGYVVAHYYSLLVLEGQRTLIQLSDPLGTGTANLLGTAGRDVDASWVTPGGVATLQVCAVVVGHVLGVVLAHDRAVRLFPRRQALPGQLPLLVLMVGYTVGGLLLLFAG